MYSEEICLLVGPSNPVMHLVAEEMALPYLLTSSDDVMAHTHESWFSKKGSRGVTYNLLPKEAVRHVAVSDVVTAYNWSEVAIIYDERNGQLTL